MPVCESPPAPAFGIQADFEHPCRSAKAHQLPPSNSGGLRAPPRTTESGSCGRSSLRNRTPYPAAKPRREFGLRLRRCTAHACIGAAAFVSLLAFGHPCRSAKARQFPPSDSDGLRAPNCTKESGSCGRSSLRNRTPYPAAKAHRRIWSAAAQMHGAGLHRSCRFRESPDVRAPMPFSESPLTPAFGIQKAFEHHPARRKAVAAVVPPFATALHILLRSPGAIWNRSEASRCVAKADRRLKGARRVSEAKQSMRHAQEARPVTWQPPSAATSAAAA